MFENDVKTYSIQTIESSLRECLEFENDVKTYSIQTRAGTASVNHCLRMM